MMGDRPSLLMRVFGPLLFLLLTGLAFSLFFLGMVALVSGLTAESTVISFNKGAMYMLGAGVGALCLSIGVVYHSLYSRKVPENLEKILIKGAIIGIIIMFVFPHAVHFSVSGIVETRKYVRCKEAEYRWLLYKKYVYTETQGACAALVNSKESASRR